MIAEKKMEKNEVFLEALLKILLKLESTYFRTGHAPPLSQSVRKTRLPLRGAAATARGDTALSIPHYF